MGYPAAVRCVAMETVGLVLVAVGLVGLGLAVREVRRLRVEVATVTERVTEVADEIGALPPTMVRSFGDGDRHLIVVEILNLFELAHRESVLTRPLTALTPRLLRDVVHRRIVRTVRESMDGQGVRADVRLHRAR
jgi:hypothetical protein